MVSNITDEAIRGHISSSSNIGIVKRIFDLSFCIPLLIATAPLFAIIIIMIRLETKGPAIFLQKRLGKNGVKFKMYKFRSMIKTSGCYKKKLKNDTDGPMFKSKNDPRVTTVGRFLRKWSLDELPQLLNVLKGEMSLVGPRPLAKREMYGDESWKRARLSVNPGITGLWQVKGRDNCKFEDWIKYDTAYVDEWSIMLDFKILFMTINAVLSRGCDAD